MKIYTYITNAIKTLKNTQLLKLNTQHLKLNKIHKLFLKMKDVRTLSTYFMGPADTKLRQKHYEKRKVKIHHYKMI